MPQLISNFIDLHVMVFLDTALRIPPLFVMDEFLKWSCGFARIHPNPDSYESILHDENSLLEGDSFAFKTDENTSSENKIDWPYLSNSSSYSSYSRDDITEMALLTILGKISCFVFGILSALIIFVLSWEKLVKVYSVILSFVIIVISYQANMACVKVITSSIELTSSPSLLQALLSLNSSAVWDSGGSYFSIAFNYIFQGLLGLLFTSLVPLGFFSVLRPIIILNFLVPSFCLILPLTSTLFTSIPVFAAIIPLCMLKVLIITHLHSCLMVLVEGYQYARMVLHNYGLHSLLESEWSRLNVPNVLRTFWLLRSAQHLSVLLSEYMYVKGEYQSLWYIGLDDMFVIFKSIMTQGCETCIALLGMTSIVSYISHYINVLLQMIILSEDDDERSMGTVCAILFFILAQQSGLTVLEGEKRFVRLCRNFSFLFTAMLHFTHNMVNPVLMSLSASRHPAMHRHVRALSVCVALVKLPCFVLYILWNQYPLSTWLLAVSAFSVQVIVKTIVSLLIYSLFLFDAYQNTFWESLDDYVYYIRAFGNSVEFIFGIMLFFTGAWIYLFESGSSIRAIMMCIHAYFNIWCEAKNGWSVFMKRRTAVNKINSLPEATQLQLDKHSDVCAICFQELQNARITRCNHFFHSVCLRKWLYVQDSCPLCHETLYKTDKLSEEPNASAPDGQNESEADNQRYPDLEEVLLNQEDMEVILREELEADGFSDEPRATSVNNVDEPVQTLRDNSSSELDTSSSEVNLRHRRNSLNNSSD